jgi:hypothetical protein
MPINIPIPSPQQNVGSVVTATGTQYPPLPYGIPAAAWPQQQGFGYITTLINPFFVSTNWTVTNLCGNTFVYWGTTVPTTASAEVSDYNNHAFQAFVFSQTTMSSANTASIYVSSSIDGYNWVGEFSHTTSSYSSSFTTSSIFRLTGRRRYFMALYSGSGSVTGSLYLISGQ